MSQSTNPTMFLNATADINTYVELAQKAGPGVINPQVFYSKQLLDTIRLDGDKYVYYRMADTAPIGDKADKLMLRRWAPLQAHTTPLTEGVPPFSDKGSVENFTINAAQYGRYMEFSDKVDFQVVDPIIAHYTKEYSLVAMETLDMLAKEALFSVANQYYASSDDGNGTRTPVASIADMDTSCTPCLNDLRVIILDMKKALVKPRSNGRFHVIASPEFYFDMIADPIVEKYMSYNQTTATMYSDSRLVPMFEMEFYEALTVPTHGRYVTYAGSVATPHCLMIDGSGNITAIDDTTVITSGGSDKVYHEIEAGYVKDARTGEDASFIPAHIDFDIDAYTAVGAAGAGLKEFKLQHVLVLGKDALLRTGLAGEDQVRVYTKEKGSSGVLDPIDQRQSIGFKINSVGFGVNRLEAVADYICCPTMVN